jgi:anti-sigma factor RsiW
MRSTHPFEQEEVMAYLDGEVTADRASEIAQHIQHCDECQALAATLRNLSREISAWEIESAPAGLTKQMNEQMASVADSKAQLKPASSEITGLQRLFHRISSWNLGRLVWASGGALLAVLLLAIAFTLSRTPRSDSYVASLNRTAPASHAASGGHGVTAGIVGGNPESHRQQLQELQKRMIQQEVASSLQKNPAADDRQFVSIERGDVSSAPPPPPPGTSASPSPTIARTASLSLVVKNFAGIEAAVKAVVSRHSGYIGELNTATPPDAAKTFSATLRVPSAQLELALVELKQLGRVDQETQSGEEVTKQYVNLAARLKNSRATEERLLGVLRNNTGKVKDVLEVENEIARVRGEIEEMEADQRTLQARIDFATITLSVTEEYKASLNAAPFSTGARLHNAFVAGYHSVVENVIDVLAWLLESGPTLLLWAALLFFPIRWAWRRVRRVFDRAPKPAAA